MPLGKRIVLIGGDLVGCELAEFLVERGREVTIVGEAQKMGGGLLIVRRMRLLAELKEQGVGMFPGARDIRIAPGAVTFLDRDEVRRTIAADHVVVAMSAHGDSTLADALRAQGHDVVEIGGGTGVTYIEGALRGAAEAVATMGR